jgi:N6-L-threonylcarbamoyladenine synthase
LGIESSCDETGVALVRVGPERDILLADVTASSMEEHSRYGGIIPEIASRAQLDELVPTLRAALRQAQLDLGQVDAIAVTAGPGLIGSLTVGAAAAKALALALQLPLYGVNHVIGHICVDQLVNGPLPQPALGLIVSGGHTSLLRINDIACDVVELGSTLDDAAGEAFDKVGRLLGLPYPGGPFVDKLAREGNSQAIKFPRGLANPKYAQTHAYDFSFSGLKTAVARYVETVSDNNQTLNVADVAASFAAAVADVLTAKAIAACQRENISTLVIGGGFSANSQLRELAAERAAAAGVTLRIPPLRFCTDNGAMIAALGAALYRAGIAPSRPDFPVTSTLPLSKMLV